MARGTVVPTATSLGLGQQRWPKVRPGEVLLLVPVGSVAQHGPHLPLATDTMIVNAVTRAGLTVRALEEYPAQSDGVRRPP